MLLPIIIPIIFGFILPFIKLEDKIRNIYVLCISILTSCMVFFTCSKFYNVPINLLTINNIYNISFNIDNFSKVFMYLLAVLWPITSIYAFGYMKHLDNVTSFFRYFLIAYGIALAVPLSANAITMYLFYELLTFATLPLIMHEMEDKQVLHAGKIYLICSILGASMALIGIIILSSMTGTTDFVFGGNQITNLEFANYKQVGYMLCFFGFSVKAAIFPFTFWLPKAGVAPTPVTALLHAVAVVKAGVFAVMRMTYFGYDLNGIRGTYAQVLPMSFAIITIIYASFMAVRAQNLKVRFAYSTASNLSYVLLTAVSMSESSLVASLTHMISHAIIKISIFFIVGAFLVSYHMKTIDDIKGIGGKLSISCACFVISSLGLIGIPLTCGFISKYYIITSLIDVHSIFATVGILAIVISSILTVIYTMTIVIKMYFPGNNFDYSEVGELNEVPNLMLIPIVITTVGVVALGLFSSQMIEFFKLIAQGI